MAPPSDPPSFPQSAFDKTLPSFNENAGDTVFPDQLWDVPVAPPAAVEGLELRVRLGVGGMGEVWSAFQPSLCREVAVKLVRSDLSERVARRFSHEARITAGLNHPNILPVHDLVETNGHPALVMKRVTGRSWAELLDERSGAGDLAVEVRRLADVCNALAAAHERGILHLDVKPDNVLVGRHGEVLLADWGCAAVFRSTPWSDSAGLPAARSIQQPFGTPTYVAPEQARGDGAALGPATDVFLLGATLFELLEGRTLRRDGPIRELLEAAQAQEEPRFSPSTPGALAALCAASLQPDPAARPASAEAFRAALVDWLEHRASHALVREGQTLLGVAGNRPDTSRALVLFEQALVMTPGLDAAAAGAAEAHQVLARDALATNEPGRAREHAALLPAGPERDALLAQAAALYDRQRRGRLASRWLRGVVVTAALLVVAALAAMTLSFIKAEEARARAEATADFNGRILSGVDPAVAGALDTTLLEGILEQAQRDAAEEFAADPTQEAEVLRLIGEAHLALGRTEAAIAALQQAHARAVEAGGPDAQLSLELELQRAQAEVEDQDWKTSVALSRIASLAQRAEAALGPRASPVLRAKVVHAYALTMAGDTDTALLVLDQAVAALSWDRRRDPARDRVATAVLRQRANTLFAVGRPEAIPLMRDLLVQAQERSGAGSPDALIAHTRLAYALLESGDLGAAQQQVDAIRAAVADRYGPDQKPTRDLFLLEIAVAEALAASGEPGRLVALTDRELDMLRAHGPGARPLTLYTDLADTLVRTQDWFALDELARLVLAAHRPLSAQSDRRIIQLSVYWAAALGRVGTQAEQGAVLTEVQQAARSHLGPSHRTTLTVQNNLANALLELDDPVGSEALHRETLAAREAALGADHPHVAWSLIGIAQALVVQGRLEEAASWFERAIAGVAGTRLETRFRQRHAAMLLRHGAPARVLHVLGALGAPDAAAPATPDEARAAVVAAQARRALGLPANVQGAAHAASALLDHPSPERLEGALLLADDLAARGALEDAQAVASEALAALAVALGDNPTPPSLAPLTQQLEARTARP